MRGRRSGPLSKSASLVSRGARPRAAPAPERLRLPLVSKAASEGSVNGWLLPGRDGAAIVDTGATEEETAAFWRLRLDDPKAPRVTDIVCTHAHRDHIGQAAMLVERTGARFHIAEDEWRGFERSHRRADGRREGTATLLRLAGVPLPETVLERKWTPPMAALPACEPAFLADGQVLALGGGEWTVWLDGGHSPAGACLLDAEAGYLIAGDQILPGTIPHVRVPDADPLADPLAAYLGFLDRLGPLDGGILVLPGHGAAFSGLPRRIAEIRAAHAKRSERILMAAAEPVTCLDLLPSVFRRVPTPELLPHFLAMAFAQINHLVTAGALTRWRAEDGSLLHRRAGAGLTAR